MGCQAGMMMRKPAQIRASEKLIAHRYAAFFELWRSQISDPDVKMYLSAELHRQCMGVNLIASESMPSPGVMAASSLLGYAQTAEGPTGKRYFPRTEGIDALEREVELRAQALFGFPHANVQPHSATQANQAVYLSVLNERDTVLSLDFRCGGHLSHGVPGSLVARFHRVETYGPSEFEGHINIEQIEERIKATNARLIVAGASAYPRQIPFANICQLARGYGVPVLADVSHTAGFIAAGLHEAVSDAEYCTMSLHKTLCGPRGGIVLHRSNNGERLNRAVFPGLQGAILPNTIAAKAICLHEAQQVSFRLLQERVLANAKAIAHVFLDEGLSLYTGGTDTHLIVLRAPSALGADHDVAYLAEIGILTNANHVHSDAFGSAVKSGIRLGTMWISQFGFDPPKATLLARVVVDALRRARSQEVLRRRLAELVDSVVQMPVS